jgi:hypothetical protein
LPDCIFEYHKSKFCYISKTSWWIMLVYLWLFVEFSCHLVYFDTYICFHFDMLFQEKSGNPVCNLLPFPLSAL